MALTEIKKGMSNAAEAINNNFQAGSILESGANENGNFIKFADGTLICQTRKSLEYASANVLQIAYIFAHPFADDSYTINATYRDTAPILNITPIAIGSKINYQAYLSCANVGSEFTPGTTAPFEVTAIGRWK